MASGDANMAKTDEQKLKEIFNGFFTPKDTSDKTKKRYKMGKPAFLICKNIIHHCLDSLEES